MEMMSQITLLQLVHYPTKKFEYRNLIETIHIINKYMWSKGLLFKIQGHLSKLLDDITKSYDQMITIL
jgi:hypothetical protein